MKGKNALKKLIYLPLLLCLLLTGCGKENVDRDSEVVNEMSEDSSLLEEIEMPDEEPGFSYADLQGIEFWFGSGAGAWSTTLTIAADGSFEGMYSDSDMGDAGDGYPGGTRYYCKFNGQLSELTQIDALTYTAKLMNIFYENAVGKEEFVDEFRYIYSDAYGLYDAETIYFYLPGTKREDLSQDCLSWISQAMYDDDYNPVEELSFVCLYNKAGGTAFYSYDLDGSLLQSSQSYEEQSYPDEWQNPLNRTIEIDLSSVEETHVEGAAVTPFTFKILSEEDNGIDEAQAWYCSNHLSLPMLGDSWDRFYDEAYEYQWVGDQLEIYERETGNCLYVLEYPTDKWYVNGNNAYLKDGIFYGASVTNGYAKPNTCFLFAYDLEHDKLLWRSADQSYNSMNFIVKGDVIICGYGFTAEKDYLYQINRNTGEILDRMELKKMPDLLVEQDGRLYVHTYSYNYVIEME